jgi:hypothetical protein
VKEQAASAFIRLSFRFERFFPQVIKLFLNRKLKEYKERGLISSYRIQAWRRGKYHYSFVIEVELEDYNKQERGNYAPEIDRNSLDHELDS